MGEDTGPIISSQYMTHQLVICYMLENIHTNLANFLGHHNPILLKDIPLAMATLVVGFVSLFTLTSRHSVK